MGESGDSMIYMLKIKSDFLRRLVLVLATPLWVLRLILITLDTYFRPSRYGLERSSFRRHALSCLAAFRMAYMIVWSK